MKQCLFPLDPYVVSCQTCTKNFEWPVSSNDGGWKSFAQKSISTDDAIKVKPKICIGNLRVFWGYLCHKLNFHQ